MKKLIVFGLAITAAVMANAAPFDWKTTSTGKMQNPGGSTGTYSGTAYLFSTAAYTQAAMFTALSGGTSVSSLTSLSSQNVSSGAIATKAFDWGTAGDTLTAYVVVQDGDNFFISDTKSAMGDASATQTLSFALKNASSAALNTSGSYAGAGWYGAASSDVPEPTSGLLMLVGLGALALRRRRA